MTEKEHTLSISTTPDTPLSIRGNTKHQNLISENINWHTSLFDALQIELRRYQDILQFHREFVLNKGSRRIDCMIIKNANSPPIDSPIASCFLQYNLIDYKSPMESMNVQNFYKVLSYAYSLPDFLHSDDVLESTTITLISSHFPRKLIKHFREKILPSNRENVIENIIPGLYHIHTEERYPFPIQLIVSPKLPSEEYLWLRCLQENLTEEDEKLWGMLGNAYQSHKDDPLYQAVMNTIIRANISNEKEVTLMCEALYELFKDDLIEHEAAGIAKGETKIISLISRLINDKRDSDIKRITFDPEYRNLLLKQYHL